MSGDISSDDTTSLDAILAHQIAHRQRASQTISSELAAVWQFQETSSLAAGALLREGLLRERLLREGLLHDGLPSEGRLNETSSNEVPSNEARSNGGAPNEARSPRASSSAHGQFLHQTFRYLSSQHFSSQELSSQLALSRRVSWSLVLARPASDSILLRSALVRSGELGHGASRASAARLPSSAAEQRLHRPR